METKLKNLKENKRLPFYDGEDEHRQFSPKPIITAFVGTLLLMGAAIGFFYLMLWTFGNAAIYIVVFLCFCYGIIVTLKYFLK